MIIPSTAAANAAFRNAKQTPEELCSVSGICPADGIIFRGCGGGAKIKQYRNRGGGIGGNNNLEKRLEKGRKDFPMGNM